MSDELVKQWDAHVSSLGSDLEVFSTAKKMRDRIEELTAKLEECRKMRHLLAGDKIDLRIPQ